MDDREPYHLIHPIDVRWGDMDAFGHVNNACYFTYCESARIAYFDAVELDAARQEPQHGPALVTATCNFLRQVHYPAALEVGARVTQIGRKSFTLDYVICRRDTAEKVADGTSVVVWVDYAVGRSIPLPEALIDRIRAWDRLRDEPPDQP